MTLHFIWTNYWIQLCWNYIFVLKLFEIIIYIHFHILELYSTLLKT